VLNGGELFGRNLHVRDCKTINTVDISVNTP
jgi:hypothetical protein